MMSENNPDVIKELVAHRQNTIRDAMRQQRTPRYRAMIGRLIIRMGERISGPEMNPRQAESRPSVSVPSFRRVRQA